MDGVEQLEQLDNLYYFTSHLNICVIYNCNKIMLDILNQHNFNCYHNNFKIILNPQSIEKKKMAWYFITRYYKKHGIYYRK